MSSESSPPQGIRVPKYCRQREKGRPDRSYVKIDGKKRYLGNFGTSGSLAKYAKMIASVQQPDANLLDQIPSSGHQVSISELLASYLEWAQGYYDPPEYQNFIAVARLLREHAGTISASDFGPRRLKQLREAMIERKWVRRSINKQIVRVRSIFRWGVENEIIAAGNLEALRAVRALREGRSRAREKPPVKPVPNSIFEATSAELSPMLKDMVKIQLLTGCRPGELLGMQPKLIDRTEKTWIYSPSIHKNTWRGKSRNIPIGPMTQKLLCKYLFGEYCFQTSAGLPYLIASYRRAISRGCQRAKVAHWSPNQLRHNAATTIRQKYGIEAASHILGHANISMSEHYAEKSLQQAKEIATKMG